VTADIEKPLVLIVEDSEPGAKLFGELVTLSGGCVEIATSGKEAMNLAIARLPALIVFDMKLPDGDGRDWAKRIRSEIDGEGPLMWACSGVPAEELLNSAWDDMPFTAWIPKPFEVADVMQRLAGVLKP